MVMLNKFLNSMRIDYVKWINGTGYDLIALRYLQPEDKAKVEKMLIRKQNKNWRDVEALDVIDSEKSIEAINKSLQSTVIETRIEAAQRLFNRKMLDDSEMETILIGILWTINEEFGSPRLQKLLQEFPTPAVKKVLLWNTLYGQENIRVNVAAFLYFLVGKTTSPVNNVPAICMQFSSKNLQVRENAFTEVCKDIGLDPATILQGMPTMTITSSNRKTLAKITLFILLFILIASIIAEFLLQNALK